MREPSAMEIAAASNGLGIHGFIVAGKCPLCSEGHETCERVGLRCVKDECKNPHHQISQFQFIDGSTGSEQT